MTEAEALVALIAELYAGLRNASKRIAELEAALAEKDQA